MNKKLYRIFAILIMTGMNWAGLFAVGNTAAAYFDEEVSQGNIFSAGAIDFLLTSGAFAPTTTAMSLPPGGSVSKEIGMQMTEESNPMQYFASSTDLHGDLPFCDTLDARASLSGVEQFHGKLSDLLTSATTTVGTWNLNLSSSPSSAFQNSYCSFGIEYNGWQTRNNLPEYPDGYSDTERATSTVYSWGLRINKIYYDVASNRGNETENEWVEIYNQTDVPLDINGWQICDNISCDILSASSTISAQGFAVITASSTTWKYWNLPSSVPGIAVADGAIGNGLANSADMLLLKRPDGFIIDQMNWGTPDFGWVNYNADVWNPGAPDAPEGNALARKPNGFDTNAPSDFVALIPPTVDLISPDENNNSLRWYWTWNYDIKWVAHNHNGLDSALFVDLYYIKDVNQNHLLDEGDTVHPIVLGTENDGVHTWTVPSGFIGDIWIRAVVTGPENPMMNAFTTSGRIYDPVPQDLFEENPESVIEAIKEDAVKNEDAPKINEDGTLGKVTESSEETTIIGLSSEPSIDASAVIEQEAELLAETSGRIEFGEPLTENEPLPLTTPDETPMNSQTSVDTSPKAVLREEEEIVSPEAVIIAEEPAVAVKEFPATESVLNEETAIIETPA
jgi:hypothetical protein